MRHGSYGLTVGGGPPNMGGGISQTGIPAGSVLANSGYTMSGTQSGFNKPPPAPSSLGYVSNTQTRSRGGHMLPELNGDRLNAKEKYGPSAGLSCSMPSSREKSPNPGGGASMPDLHDCSMCLAAYIQSLNTVCGSASRLSQCLAGLSSQSSSSSQHLREACDGWEGLTRAVGVASAAVKAHMLSLLQEATRVSSVEETCEEDMGSLANSRKQHMDKLVSSLCMSFLSLQCQFSAAVLETFTPYTSVVLPMTPPSSIDQTPSLSSQYSTPATPPHFTAQLTPPPSACTHFTLTSNTSQQGSPASKMRSRTNSLNYLNPHNTTLHLPWASSMDYSFRRWSMGASGYNNNSCSVYSGGGSNNNGGDKLDSNKISGPGPPRRWSVPDANNDPPPVLTSGCTANTNDPASSYNMWGGNLSTNLLSSCSSQWSGLTPDTCSGEGSAGGPRLSVPSGGAMAAAGASSRESSAGGSRSNSHSRSATPDPSKSPPAIISQDELDELVCLMSSTSGAPPRRIRSSKLCSAALTGSSLAATSSSNRSSKSDISGGSSGGKSDPSSLLMPGEGDAECTKSDIAGALEECKKSEASQSSCGVRVCSGSAKAKGSCQQHCHHLHHRGRHDCFTYAKQSHPGAAAEADKDSNSKSRVPLQQPLSSVKRGGTPAIVTNVSLNKCAPKHGNAFNTQYQRQRAAYYQFSNNQLQKQQQYHLQQVQLQQYLYQQQLQANAYFKLSPISSSVLKQQQYFPLLQQHILQKQQQQMQMQQLQQLKLNQSLQLLHLQQQQQPPPPLQQQTPQQQQQRFQHQQQRKNSLQNLSSYYQELSSLSSLYIETPDDTSSNSSRRGSGNTGNSSNNSGGATTRTPVIHEATMETADSGIVDESGASHWLGWGSGSDTSRQLLSSTASDQSSLDRSLECCVLQQAQHKVPIPEVVTTSTPLWPPSGSVPGVTLTQCTEEFKQPAHHHGSSWPPTDAAQETVVDDGRRETLNRSSWPSGHSFWGSCGLSLGGLIEDSCTRDRDVDPSLLASLSSKQQQQQLHHQQPFMRRHSDTSSFGPYQASYQQHLASAASGQEQLRKYQVPPPLRPLSPGRNSRSSDSLHMVPDSSEMGQMSCMDSNMESLLTLSALVPSSSPSSPTTHYSLFGNSPPHY